MIVTRFTIMSSILVALFGCAGETRNAQTAQPLESTEQQTQPPKTPAAFPTFTYRPGG